MPNEIEIVVTGKSKGLDKVEREAKQAGDKIGREMEKGFREAERAAQQARQEIERELQRTSDAARQAGADAGNALTDGLSNSFSGGDLDLGGMLPDLLGGLGAIGAIGATIGGTLLAGLSRSMQEMEIGGMIAAQNGGSSAAAAKLGDVAGDAFNDGFGSSLEEMGDTVNAVISQGLVSMDAPAEAIGEITRLAQTAAEVTGNTANEVSRSISIMLKTGMADTAREAFDLVVSGSQRGANAAGDLVDVLTESSVNLRRFGLSGQQSVGVLLQALEAGAPSADSFTGALEELVGNASDGIPVFNQLGLNGEAFARQLAGGGSQAAAALDTLFDRIRSIEDPAQQSAVMVQLFGEEASALQDAILAVDPSEAADKMTDFAGSTKQASETMRENKNAFTELGRGVANFVDMAGQGWAEFFGMNDRFADSDMGKQMIELAEANERAAAATDEAGAAGSRFAEGFEEADEAASSFYETLDMLVGKQEELQGIAMDLTEAQMEWNAVLDSVAGALETNGKGLDITTESGRANQEVLNDLAKSSLDVAGAMTRQGASSQQVTRFMERARAEQVRAAIQFGATGAEAKRAADRFRLIPGNYRAQVSANTGGAMNALGRVGSALNMLDGRHAVVRVSAVGSALGLRTGGIVGSGLSFLEHGGIVGAGSAGVWGAQSGGQRHSSTVINEAGPELVELPNGARVMTAGATRAMAEAGALGGGGAARVEVRLGFEPGSDSAAGQMFQELVRRGLLRLQVNGDPVRVG